MRRRFFPALCALALLAEMLPPSPVRGAEDIAALLSPAVFEATGDIQQGRLTEGVAVLRRAAEAGDAAAEYWLAFHLSKGLAHAASLSDRLALARSVTDEDRAEIARWLDASAAQGYLLAQLGLAMEYEMGVPVPRHPRLARDYYAAVAAKGWASGRRGVVRLDASLGAWADVTPGADEAEADARIVARDYAGAAPLYLRAAQAGSATAAYELPSCAPSAWAFRKASMRPGHGFSPRRGRDIRRLCSTSAA